MKNRKERIVQIADREGAISFANLKKNFPDISDITLRRDLEALDRENRIIRVHGGIKSAGIDAGGGSPLATRSFQNIDKKRAIAAAAAQFARQNASVFIDSGTTCLELCRCFPSVPILAFTSGVNCALQLNCVPGPQVYLPGGLLQRDNLALSGSACVAGLMNVHFNVAFIGASGYTPETGFTCCDGENTQLKRTAIDHAEKTVILMDSSKMGISSTFSFAALDEVDVVVTDDGILPELLTHLRASNADVLTVAVPGQK